MIVKIEQRESMNRGMGGAMGATHGLMGQRRKV